jgi:hypothetical protein
MAVSDYRHLRLVGCLLSPEVQLPLPLAGQEVPAKLSEAEVAKVFTDHVPGIINFLYRERPGPSALHYIQKAYRDGLEAFAGTTMNAQLKLLMRSIVHHGHECRPGAAQYLREVAEAFTHCQAVQARTIERAGRQIRDGAHNFKDLVTELIGEYKRIALKMLAAERRFQGHASDLEEDIHYENSLAADMGDLIGLDAEDVRRASLDTHARSRFRRLSASEAEGAAARCRELFDLEALVQAFACRVNSLDAASTPESLPCMFCQWCAENMREAHVIFGEDGGTGVRIERGFALAVLEILFLGEVSDVHQAYWGKSLTSLFLDGSPRHKRCRIATTESRGSGSAHESEREVGALASPAVPITMEALQSAWARADSGSGSPEMLRERVLDRFLQACETCSAFDGFSCGIEVMFHRTAADNIQGISELGLLVANDVDIPRAHGAKLGSAVYLSPDFDFGTRYGDVAILCLALPGYELPCSSTDWPASPLCPYLSKRWKSVVLACRHRAQVLPLAVVQDDNWHEISLRAKAIAALIGERFPGLQRPHLPTVEAGGSGAGLGGVHAAAGGEGGEGGERRRRAGAVAGAMTIASLGASSVGACADWVTMHSISTGRLYYYNRSTGVSCADLPAEAAAAQGWVRVESKGHPGRFYFRHSVTGECKWAPRHRQ